MRPTDLRDRPVSRRCALLGAGGVGAVVVLAACSSGSDGSGSGSGDSGGSGGSAAASTSAGTTPTGAPASSSGASSSAAAGGAAIASLSDIPVGGTAAAKIDGENVLLSQPTAGKVEAFSAVCPHQGATVQPDGAKFHCPLHGSEFDLTGAVTEGPARKPLTSIAVTVSGDSVVKA